jgi:hypothetical protein
MGATGPLFYLQKLVTLLILGLQHTMNLSAQMLVTLLDLSIYIAYIRYSKQLMPQVILQELFDNLSNISNTDNHIASFELVKHYCLEFIL